MKRRMTAAVVAGIAVGLATAGTVALAASAYMLPAPVAVKARHHPKIVAKPISVMVNRSTTLTGSGFKPHAKLVLNECSAKTWVVPQRLCNHRNAVHVHANAHGGFRVRMKALVCPRPRQPQARVLAPKGFSQHCFIGVPKILGIDQETLAGAVRITVTGP